MGLFGFFNNCDEIEIVISVVNSKCLDIWCLSDILNRERLVEECARNISPYSFSYFFVFVLLVRVFHVKKKRRKRANSNNYMCFLCVLCHDCINFCMTVMSSVHSSWFVCSGYMWCGSSGCELRSWKLKPKNEHMIVRKICLSS